MSRRPSLSLAIAAALGLAPPGPARAQAPLAANDSLPSFLTVTDEVTVASGLRVLRSAALPAGERELRLWVGFGITTPNYLVRLRYGRRDRVQGWLILHYPNDAETRRLFRKDFRGRCSHFRSAGEVETCVARFARAVWWPDVARRLDSLQVWTLPDESRLPRPEVIVLDGTSLLVEVRDGAHYRAYQYGPPEYRREPEAKNAAAIIGLVLALSTRTHTCAELPKEWCR